MVQSTQGTLFRMKSLARADMYGQMEKLMKVNGRRIRCTDMVYSSGRMVKSTRATSQMTSVKARASLLGKMAESMMDSGKMANNTAEVNLYQKMAKRDLVNGRMEERSSGLIE